MQRNIMQQKQRQLKTETEDKQRQINQETETDRQKKVQERVAVGGAAAADAEEVVCSKLQIRQ